MTMELSDVADELNFAVEKSLRYHQRRRAFYDGWHRIIMFALILIGSASFADVVTHLSFYTITISGWGGLVVAALAALDLVFSLGDKARDHEILHRRFTDLAISIRTEAETPERLQLWERRRLEMETDEPPIFWALEASCDNEVIKAWGRDVKNGLVALSPWQRLMMNYLRFQGTDFPHRGVAA